MRRGLREQGGGTSEGSAKLQRQLSKRELQSFADAPAFVELFGQTLEGDGESVITIGEM